MGEASLAEAFAAAHRLELPAYTFPEDAVRAFGALWQRAAWLQRDTDAAPRDEQAENTVRVQRARARRDVQNALLIHRGAGRAALDAAACRPLLEAYGLPVPPEGLALDPADAVEFAERIGYPVALKLISPDILHKSDIGGVLLNVADAEAVRAGFTAIIERAHAAHPGARPRVLVQKMVTGGQEVIIGVKRDLTFGPLVLQRLGWAASMSRRWRMSASASRR